MKTIEIWPRAIDRKIGTVLCVAAVIAVGGAVGTFLPDPTGYEAPWFDPFLTAVLLPFLWGSFRLVRPIRHRQAWVVAEFVVVPLLWLLLITALGFWFAHLRAGSEEEELLQVYRFGDIFVI